MFQVIKQKGKLSSRVADELEQSIMNKRFVAEQPLPSEARLCKSFGVSRTVVREAIQQLKSQGIVHSIPGSGNYISKNDTGNLKRSMSLLAKLNEDTPLHHEMLRLRELLEIECIKEACRNEGTELLKSLNWYLDEMLASTDDINAFGVADYTFHLVIMKASGNTLFCAIWESLYDDFLKVSQKVYAVQGAMDRVCSEHAVMIKAIESKDEVQASTLLREHIQQTKDGI